MANSRVSPSRLKLDKDTGRQALLEPEDASPESLRDREIRRTRQDAFLVCAADELQFLDIEGAVGLQGALKHGDAFGYWQTPEKWNSRLVSEALTNVNLRKRILNFLPERAKLTVIVADGSAPKLSVASMVEPFLTNAERIQEIVTDAVLAMTRYLLLLRIGPAGQGRRGGAEPLDPSHIADIAYNILPPLFAIGVAKRIEVEANELSSDRSLRAFPAGEFEYLKLVTSDDISQMVAAESIKRRIQLETRRALRLSEKGYWRDSPSTTTAPTKITKVSGPALKREPQKFSDPHIPFPDEYISEMGQRSIWLIRELGPNLLQILGYVLEVWQKTDIAGLQNAGVQARRQSDIKKYLQNYEWRNSKGEVINKLPFTLQFSQIGKSSPVKLHQSSNQPSLGIECAEEVNAREEISLRPLTQVWPPRVFIDIMGLARNVQFAHLFVMALSTGARRSEILSLSRNCISYDRSGRPNVSGKTFKLVQRHDGEKRDWPLPDLAVEALNQQSRLVRLLEDIGPQKPVRVDDRLVRETLRLEHLWFQPRVTSGARKEALTDLNKALSSYASTLGMDLRPGNQALRSHRFRKTVARLAALALTQAPKILMDVFGHKSIEMTLHYILTDKDLRGEIEQVSRELRVMRAKAIVQEMVDEEDADCAPLDNGGFGGPAALTIQQAVRNTRKDLDQRGDKWTAKTAIELAEILTLNGKAWNYVREGVICTKFPGTESGLCNMSRGLPEPSRCHTSCSHRLEEKFAREDTNLAIQKCVGLLKSSYEEDDELAQAMWTGQLRLQLDRFTDLRQKWVALPLVRKALADIEKKG